MLECIRSTIRFHNLSLIIYVILKLLHFYKNIEIPPFPSTLFFFFLSKLLYNVNGSSKANSKMQLFHTHTKWYRDNLNSESFHTRGDNGEIIRSPIVWFPIIHTSCLNFLCHAVPWFPPAFLFQCVAYCASVGHALANRLTWTTRNSELVNVFNNQAHI